LNKGGRNNFEGNHLDLEIDNLISLIWFDFSVYYDLTSVQIHEALYKFIYLFYYEIDYVDIDKFLNNEQNSDTVWLHVLSGFTGVIALFELNLSCKIDSLLVKYSSLEYISILRVNGLTKG